MRMRRSSASCILGDSEGLIADLGAAGPRRSRRTCAVGNAAGPFANAVGHPAMIATIVGVSQLLPRLVLRE